MKARYWRVLIRLGVIHNWRQPSPYRPVNPRLQQMIRKLNQLREKYAYLSDFGNLGYFTVSGPKVYFERFSKDRTKTLQVTVDIQTGQFEVYEHTRFSGASRNP